MSASLSLSLAHHVGVRMFVCVHLCVCAHNVSLFSVHLLHTLIIEYIYIYTVYTYVFIYTYTVNMDYRYLYIYIDISYICIILYIYIFIENYSSHQSQFFSIIIIVATPSRLLLYRKIKKTIPCLYTRIWSQ